MRDYLTRRLRRLTPIFIEPVDGLPPADPDEVPGFLSGSGRAFLWQRVSRHKPEYARDGGMGKNTVASADSIPFRVSFMVCCGASAWQLGPPGDFWAVAGIWRCNLGGNLGQRLRLELHDGTGQCVAYEESAQ